MTLMLPYSVPSRFKAAYAAGGRCVQTIVGQTADVYDFTFMTASVSAITFADDDDDDEATEKKRRGVTQSALHATAPEG